MTAADLDTPTTEEGTESPTGPSLPAGPSDAPRAPGSAVVHGGRLLRPAIAAGATTLAASVLIGGMFEGFTPRIYAGLGGLVGVLVAAYAARPSARPVLRQVAAVGLVLGAGVLALGLSSPASLSRLPKVVGEAVTSARLRQPPVPFETGWRALLVWVMGACGFGATWIGAMFRRPALCLVVPLPLVAFAAIGQPPEAEVPSGITAFALYVVALTVLFRAAGDEGEQMPIAFEIKRMLKALPLAILLIVGLIAISQTDVLFPAPAFDPTEKAQRPKAKPLSEVVDRPLFSVESDSTGPWRTGGLDTYDGESWLLPPFSQSRLRDIPNDGILNPALPRQIKARFTVSGLDGTVLPLPTRTVGIAFRGPKLVFDPRTDTLRTSVGQIRRSFSYEAASAGLPPVGDLQAAALVTDTALKPFLAAPPVPGVIQGVIDQAPAANQWDRLDFVRKRLLDEVTATGSGLPVPVPPRRVAEMLVGDENGAKEGSPFEIVAGQALLARWVGVPSRIGFGYDGGKEIRPGVRELRPSDGTAFLEVYFNGFGWLPVTGAPKKAKASVGANQGAKETVVIPSDEIGVVLFIPLRTEPPSDLADQVRRNLLIAAPFFLVAILAYLLYPAVAKRRRSLRRRRWALQSGPHERIAVAYAEFRDYATDLGVGHPEATPLAFLQRVVDDEEHSEFAWLVTRALYGDLAGVVGDDEVLVAEELSRGLRSRLGRAQPATIRLLAALSRLSLRNPYAPELVVHSGRPRASREVQVASA